MYAQLTHAEKERIDLSSDGVSLWLSFSTKFSDTEQFFDTVRGEFGPGGESTFGGVVVPADDAINKMAKCDYAVERVFLIKVLAAPGTKLLIAEPCGGEDTTNADIWQQISSNANMGPMMYTKGGDPSEYPPNMIGEWLAFSPDNRLGGFAMGVAACQACTAQKNMPILFIKAGPDEPRNAWCEQVYEGFKEGLNTCPSDYNFLAMTKRVEKPNYAEGVNIVSEAMVQNPAIRGIATCADSIAGGATDFW